MSTNLDRVMTHAEKIAHDRDEQLANSKPYVPGPYVPGTYSVIPRGDEGHFDVLAPRRPGYVQWYYKQNPTSIAYPMHDDAIERAFCIRGTPGKVFVRDERWDIIDKFNIDARRESLKFPSVESAMAWITATLLIGVRT